MGVIREIRDKDISYQKRTGLLPNRVYNSREFIIKSIEHNEWYAPSVLNLYRYDFLIQNNMFFKNGIYYEDQEIILRLYLAAKYIVYVDYAFYNYVERANSIMSSKNTSKKRNDILSIWDEWFRICSNITDEELRCYINGALVKYYLHSCRQHKIYGWKVSGMHMKFALKYALNLKEKFKVIIFSIIPSLYVSI